MTPDELAVVQATFAAAQDQIDELTTRFYEELFDLDGGLRAMFGEDMAAQRVKLADQLVAIVGAMGRLGELVALTQPLGARHAEYGVQPHHYEYVREALLAALAHVLGDDFDEPARHAWTRGYDLVAETMMLGAAG